MKKRNVRKVAVLGSGVMGAAIAAHCANAGIPVLLLDVVPEDAGPRERNRLAAGAVRALGKTRPAPLFTRDVAGRIEVGNLVDDLGRLAEVDWVIEAVRETLEIKRTVLAAAARHVRPDALLTTNTSGLPLHELERALPPEARRSFAGVHFFNPPRYMRLVELIAGPSTSPDVLDHLEELCTSRLGKGVVRAKDTPNFVANRIGIHALMAALEAMRELGLTIEEVDEITGSPLGRPKTGTFRLADLVGVDVVALVAHNVRELARDESAAMFAVPAYVERMIERGLLGQKTGSGFYHKPRDGRGAVRTLDLETLEYRDALRPDLPDLARVQRIEDPGERLRALVGGEGRASLAAWRVLAPTLAYSARRVGEIADDVETIDRAMRLGYNWALGPFEAWDALGFRDTAARLREDGHALPRWVEDRLARGATKLYEVDGRREDARAVRPATLRRAGAEVRGNRSASLVDLGEGVLGLEFHSKLNALDRDSIDMMLAAPDEAAAGFGALVVANDGEGFCAGANLKMLLELVGARDFRGIEELVRSFQRATDALERCAVPVVVAPHGLALGGGCEIVLAGAAVRAAAESYIGLAEAGVGLLPAGGGCLRLYKRNLARLGSAPDAFPAFKETFETIAMAKVSGSAAEARELGFLRPGDAWSMNPDHRVRDARELALALASGGYAPRPAERALPVLGESGMAWVEAALANLAEGNFASEHDCNIGREIGRVLSGGAVAGPTAVSEQHVLDLEVEGFLRLCGEPKTHARIQAMLETGKPLRN